MRSATRATPDGPAATADALDYGEFCSLVPAARHDPAGLRLAWIDSPLGTLVAGAKAGALCFLEFSGRERLARQLRLLEQRFGPPARGECDTLAALQRQLADYFAGRLRAFSLPLAYPGTAFQERVWNELLRIPYGETRSYSDVAASIGTPDAIRAVGTTNGANRLAIVIPCHRVVNKGGRLGGYGGGLWRKQWLLDLERGDRLL